MKAISGSWLLALRSTINLLSYRWQASPLPGFLQWWRRELISCLPAQWRGVFESTKNEILLHWRGNVFWTGSDEKAFSFAQLNSHLRNRYVLILPREQILLTYLRLPAAVAQDVSAALSFEMDKYTPFKASQVYFDFRLEPDGDRAPTILKVCLAVVLRERLDAILDEAARQGHQIDVVDADSDKGVRLNINLLPSHRRQQNRHPIRKFHIFMAFLGFALLGVAMLLFVHNRQVALEGMNQQVQALRHETLQVQTLRQQLSETLESGRYVTARKTQSTSLASLLRELTLCIPTHTWLEQLDISQDGQIMLSGQSGQTSALINEMKACQSLENIQFQGIIQPDTSTGQDRFNMLAHFRNKDITNASVPEAH